MLYLAAAVLIGIGSTHNVGERSPAFVVAADIRHGAIQAEGFFTTADKIETGDGWATRLGADLWSGPISIGVSWSHRETGLWSKDKLFARASAQHGPLMILAEVAPTSENMEAKAEVRYRAKAGHIIVEPRAFIEWHTTAEELGGYAYGISILLGYGQ